MEAFVILFGLIVLATVVLVINLALSEPIQNPICEGLHDWVNDSNERLVCMNCGYKPGDNQ